MSGIYLSTGDIQHAKKAGSALAFTNDTSIHIGNDGGLIWAVTRVDSMSLWGPAHDELSGITILLGGRVSFDEEDWQEAEKTPYTGGLACRRLLDVWIKRRGSFTNELNGAFLVVVIDTRERLVHIFTDRLGVYPIYQANSSVFSVCSHPDVLADDLKCKGITCDIDWTTIAECIGTASSVQPYTYYQKITQLEPATQYIREISTEVKPVECAPFWEPAYMHGTPSENTEDLAEDLATALKNAVYRRTLPRLGKAAVMLSGGADSRAVLYSAYDPSKMTCFTLFDEPNKELATAAELARVAGSLHVPLQRNLEYYGNSAEESVCISGGLWSIEDSHYHGYLESFKNQNIDAVLTGCYADYMFKGLLLNRKHRKLFGKNLPLFDLAGFDYNFYQHHTKLRDQWQVKVNERLNDRFDSKLTADYKSNCLEVENLRLRPLIREPDAMGRLVLWRTLPWDHVLSDAEVLNVYGRIHYSLKLNGAVFGKAIGKLMGKKAGKILNSNFGTPVDASEYEKTAWFLLGVLKRKANRLVSSDKNQDALATSGSWPNWLYLITNSQSIRKLWASPTPEERNLFSGILGYDLWDISIEDWAIKDHLLFSRLITIRTWLRQRNFIDQ